MKLDRSPTRARWKLRRLPAALAGLAVSVAALAAWQVTARQAPAALNDGHWVTVEERPLSQPILAPGQLQPGTVVGVTAPFDGKIVRRWVAPGDHVAQGAPLLEVDTGDILLAHREAQAARVKAAEELRRLKQWQSGSEVLTARRQLASAQLTLQAARTRLDETRTLHDKGIVARTELDGAKMELDNATAQWQAADDSLRSTLQEASPAKLEVATLEHQNRLAKAEQIAGSLQRAVVTAPCAGVVLAPPPEPGATAVAKEFAAGSVVSQRDVLMSIGDTATYVVRAQVDEHDVLRVRPGMRAEVALGAEPSRVLQGTVRRVAAQARRDFMQEATGAAAMFDIEVVVPDIDAAQRGQLLVGMTARVQISPDAGKTALAVPLASVMTDAGAPQVLRWTPAAAQGERVAVTTGATSADRVVVLTGLQAGDRVWVPATPGATAESPTASAGERP